jgi:hypothetical protein
MSETATQLERLEAELSAVFDEHRDAIVQQVARVLVALAVDERQNANQPAGPKLCALCRTNLAAHARRVCDGCRGRQRRAQERLRRQVADERATAANGSRGPRAAELAKGARTVVGHVDINA